ncbi:hypothetical protein [Nonomuraea sediminis]|uniref:hypothetical protein n=1 Tax=Nonomuraea sediminis TaxID=2835864 RepID=UPI001BDBD6F4|nr:hypothetical protein [Nonomuraea sediminis]
MSDRQTIEPTLEPGLPRLFLLHPSRYDDWISPGIQRSSVLVELPVRLRQLALKGGSLMVCRHWDLVTLSKEVHSAIDVPGREQPAQPFLKLRGDGTLT